jgi:hypothetical protein
MANRIYDIAGLRWQYDSVSDDTVDLGGVPVPRTFTVCLDHPEWPARVDLVVTVYPDRGPMATGLGVVDPDAVLPDPFGFREMDDLITRTIDRKRLLEDVTAQAAGWRAAWLAYEQLLPAGQDLPEKERAERIRQAWLAGSRVTDVAYGMTKPRRRHFLTQERLREVAATYRAAVEAGEAPTKAVAEKWGVPHSTASKWVQRARKEGVLGTARGTRPGEDRS